MPRDVKSAAPRPTSAAGMNPLFLGIIIGLLSGMFLALGVAIWVNRASSPFVEKNKPTEALAPVKSPEAKATTNTATNATTNPGAPTAEKPRFEFYQILPGEKAGTGKTPTESVAKKAESKAEPKILPAPPSVPPDAPKVVKSTAETQYLQAGAFQNESEADNMKAKIAFAGFEATVTRVNVADKGTLFRVRLGPYKNQDEVNRIKSVLSQNGIAAAVVKAENQ